MDPWHDLSQKVKAIRKTRNLSQAEFSQELGVAKSTLQKLEDGKSVSLATLQHIAEQMGAVLSVRFQDEPEECATAEENAKKLVEDLCVLVQLPENERKQVIAVIRRILDVVETTEWS